MNSYESIKSDIFSIFTWILVSVIFAVAMLFALAQPDKVEQRRAEKQERVDAQEAVSERSNKHISTEQQ